MARVRGRKTALRSLVAAVGLVALICASAASALELRVRDNHLVDAKGKVIRLLGVNRSGAEYACIQGYGFSDGPTDRHSIRGMNSGDIKVWRGPLNEELGWGIN